MGVAGRARGRRERGPGRRREGRARRLLEGVGVGGVVRHERLAVQGRAAELGQEAELRVVLAVSGYQHGRQHWRLHAAVVVGVDAHLFLLGAEWELAALQRLQLVVRLQVRPAPHPAVDDMGQPLAVGHLQPPVQGAGNGHALAGLPWAAERPLQLIHGSFLLL